MGYVRAALFCKNHWKQLLIIAVAILLAPLLLISVFTSCFASTPAVNDNVIKIYKSAAQEAGKGKVEVNWQPLVAIDAVRFQQDFSKTNFKEALELANMFIKTEKKEIRYNFKPYEDSVSAINKKYKIKIDWKEVLMFHSISAGNDVGNDKNNKNISDIANKFVKKEIKIEKYTVYEKRKVKETKIIEVKEKYKVWEYYDWVKDFDLDWLLKFFNIHELGHYVTKTRIVKKKVTVWVTKTVPVTKTRSYTVYSAKTLDTVLKEEGLSRSSIPNKFKDKSKISENMLNKYETIYTLKSFDEVLNELHFTSQQREEAYRYMETGMSNVPGFEGGCDTIDSQDGVSGERYNIPRMYQFDQRWASIPYGNGTIKSSACGPSSFAMIATGMNPKNLSRMDSNHDGILDPKESAAWSVSHGYRVNGQGTSWEFFKAAGKEIGLDVKQYSKSQGAEVYKALKNGYPAIASMTKGHFTSGGHFIVLAGLDTDGKVKVNDPNSRSRSLQTWDFNSIIQMEATQFWTFSKPMGNGSNFVLTSYTGDPSENGGVAGRNSATGVDLWKKSITDRLIAVDPSVIKLKSKVYIKFPENKRYITLDGKGKKFDLNGVYTAVDTGGDIKKNRIDLYVGFDGVNVRGKYYKIATDIGRVNVKVYKDY